MDSKRERDIRMNCQCQCEDYEQCINCPKYDKCEYKPRNPLVGFIILGWLIFLVGILTVIII